MRKVKRSDVPVPVALKGKNSDAAKEHAEAISFFSKKKNKNVKFEFAVYKDASIKEAFRLLFFAKCAYCESDYASTAPVDVEHYRPKGGVVVRGKLRKPGYYWLAAEWSNLLPSCIDCNRSRTKEFEGELVGKSGKANLFPISNQDSYAKKPGEEKKEKRLLLDPCRDKPGAHLEFLVPEDPDDDRLGLVRAKQKSNGRVSEKGEHSIEVYGLSRLDLIKARRGRLISVLAHIVTVKEVVAEIEERGESDRLNGICLLYTSPSPRD